METVGNKVVSILLTILPRWLNGPDPLLHTPATQVSPSWGKKVSSDNNICLLPAENVMSLLNYRVFAALSAIGLTQCQVIGELRISSGDNGKWLLTLTFQMMMEQLTQCKVIGELHIPNCDRVTQWQVTWELHIPSTGQCYHLKLPLFQNDLSIPHFTRSSFSSSINSSNWSILCFTRPAIWFYC